MKNILIAIFILINYSYANIGAKSHLDIDIYCANLSEEIGKEISSIDNNSFKWINPISGVASWYGVPFHGRIGANGQVYNMNNYTCAVTWNKDCRILGYKFGTKLKVTNTYNQKSVIVTVTDTGSFGEKYKRVLDLSKAAFSQIANTDQGIINIKIEKL